MRFAKFPSTESDTERGRRVEAARDLALWAHGAFVAASRAYCSRACRASDKPAHVGRCVALYTHAKAQHARFTARSSKDPRARLL